MSECSEAVPSFFRQPLHTFGIGWNEQTQVLHGKKSRNKPTNELIIRTIVSHSPKETVTKSKFTKAASTVISLYHVNVNHLGREIALILGCNVKSIIFPIQLQTAGS